MSAVDLDRINRNATARHAHHEAGHAVAAVALGAELVDVYLGTVDWSDEFGANDTPGGTVHRTPVSLQPFVTYAGPWAEAKWAANCGGCELSDALFNAWGESADGDGEKYAQRPLTIAQESQWEAVLESLWPAIGVVARLLVADGKLTVDGRLKAYRAGRSIRVDQRSLLAPEMAMFA